MLTRARGGWIVHRCQNKKSQIEKLTSGCEWRHAPEAHAEDFGDFEKSELSPASEEDGWLSLARRGLVSGAHVVWGRWKIQVYLSPYVEKPLNSKVIKSFVPELRSRKCFSCFVIPMFYEYMLWTFYVHFTYPCMAMVQLLYLSWILCSCRVTCFRVLLTLIVYFALMYAIKHQQFYLHTVK